MINPRELRIGNWIDEQGLEIQVGWIHSELFKGSEPIPLTEEVLIKFGFENSKTQDKFFTKDNSIGISTADNKFRFIQGNFVCQLVIREIKFVHELQNIYFAIAGKELTL